MQGLLIGKQHQELTWYAPRSYQALLLQHRRNSRSHAVPVSILMHQKPNVACVNLGVTAQFLAALVAFNVQLVRMQTATALLSAHRAQEEPTWSRTKPVPFKRKIARYALSTITTRRLAPMAQQHAVNVHQEPTRLLQVEHRETSVAWDRVTLVLSQAGPAMPAAMRV